MILYHGTTVDIDRIDLMKSKPNKDFGRAFYLSEDYKKRYNSADANRRISKRSDISSICIGTHNCATSRGAITNSRANRRKKSKNNTVPSPRR